MRSRTERLASLIGTLLLCTSPLAAQGPPGGPGGPPVTSVTADVGLTGGGAGGALTLGLDLIFADARYVQGVTAGQGLSGGGTAGTPSFELDLDFIDDRYLVSRSDGSLRSLTIINDGGEVFVDQADFSLGKGELNVAFGFGGENVGIDSSSTDPDAPFCLLCVTRQAGRSIIAESGLDNVSWGIGVVGASYGIDGQGGLFESANAAGQGRGLTARTSAANGVAGFFSNESGDPDGAIIAGAAGEGNPVFWVYNDGLVTTSGDMHATNFVTFSSSRHKTDVEPLDDALGKVGRLRGVAFHWRDDGRRDVGLIAEEVAEVLPEVVALDEDGSATGVDYSRLVAVLIEAVKQQQSEIDALRAEIRAR